MESLEPRLARIETKVDATLDKLETTNIILSKQAVVLEEHSRRSLASEGRLDVLEKHVVKTNTVWRVLGILGAFCVGLATILGTVALFLRH